MDRPPEHVTDTLGQTQLRGTLEPLGWTLSEGIDYGIDFDVEVFENNKSTGITFKIQLKSSRASVYSAGSDFISQPVEVKSARYLITEMQVPTILVHADVERGRTFWLAPQFEVEIGQRIALLNDDSSVTLRIPTPNELPNSADLLLQAVVRAKVLLATRSLATAGQTDFVAALRKQPNLDVTIKALKEKTDALRAERAYQLMLKGALNDAETDLRKIGSDDEASLSIRFAAVLALEQVEIRQSIRDRVADKLRVERTAIAAGRLRTLVKSGPLGLKLYALALRKVSRLQALMDERWGLFLHVELARKKGASHLWAAQLAFRWATLTQRVNQKLRECFGFLNYALATPDGLSLGDPIQRFGKLLVMLAAQLKLEGEPDAEENLKKNAFQLLRLAAELAKLTGDEQRFADAITAVRLLSTDLASPENEWLAEQFALIRDPDVRAEAQEHLEGPQRHKKGEKSPYTTVETAEKQIYENFAAGVGIDLQDPDDPIAAAVRIGIQDLDPTPALRHCEHTFITLQPNPLLMHILKLPTAGLKVLHCTKHGYAIKSQTLDDAGKTFREQFCSKCPDAVRRPADWTFSTEWQLRENARHTDFAREFWRSPPAER